MEQFYMKLRSEQLVNEDVWSQVRHVRFGSEAGILAWELPILVITAHEKLRH